MNNIAIFVSGNGDAAQRIVKLFNEGNRVKTVLVYADDSATDLADRINEQDVEILHYQDQEWLSKAPELAKLLRDKEVKLLVLDQFALTLPDEIMETTGGEMIRVSNPELAPREVVAALEADLRKPREPEVVEVEEPDAPSTPESEWADALKIQFTPPKVPTPPEPPVADSVNDAGPVDNIEPEPPFQSPNQSEYYNRPQGNGYYKGENYQYNHLRERREEENRPMPSTWMIWSILVTIFCCFIPGIVAIIFSSQVSTRYFSGDYEGAQRASRIAEAWIIVSFVLGVISATLYFPFMIFNT